MNNIPKRAQAAVEYLTTYGWALLIIAVVIVAFLELGVFNPYTFTPREQPGSCQVIKTVEAGGFYYQSLQGTCNEGLPVYTAMLGTNSVINITNPRLGQTMCNETITFWERYSGTAAVSTSHVFDIWTPSGNPLPTYIEYVEPNQIRNVGAVGTDGRVVNVSQWMFTGIELGQGIEGDSGLYAFNLGSSGYELQSEGNGYCMSAENVSFGGIGSNSFTGFISNIQIYNTTLSSADIVSLYDEGVGGAPENLRDLIGWWPLNGNSNDYSGYNQNVMVSNELYIETWTSGYKTPCSKGCI